jgi:transcriptional regulator with XRE-family HTH domain
MHNHIKEKLSSLLKKKRYTVEKLANLCELPRNSVYNVLYGRTKNYKVVAKIAKALSVSVDYLLSDKENLEILTNIDKKELEKFSFDTYVQSVDLVSNILRNKKLQMSASSFVEISMKVYTLLKNKKSAESASYYAEGVIDSQT